jgi:beta-phosphoglucomutase
VNTAAARALQAIVFDFDGVLADTEPLHLRVFQEVLARRGVALDRADYYDKYLGYDDEDVFRHVAKDRGARWSEDEVAQAVGEKSALYLSKAASERVLFPGVAGLVSHWAASVPLAIASGSFRHEIDAVLGAAGLQSLFPVIVGAGETARGKPAPDPYRAAIEQLGVDPGRSVAVEDSVWGITSAHDAGMKVVAVASSYARDQLGSADAVVEAFGELTLELFEELTRR